MHTNTTLNKARFCLVNNCCGILISQLINIRPHTYQKFLAGKLLAQKLKPRGIARFYQGVYEYRLSTQPIVYGMNLVSCLLEIVVLGSKTRLYMFDLQACW